MIDSFFNRDAIATFSASSFQQRLPFPWADFEDFLTAAAFRTLLDEFPPLELFEYHENIYRLGQRPHNRYYLAYEHSIYSPTSNKPEAGKIQKKNLSSNWQLFIEELEQGPFYRNFIQETLAISGFTIRYAWHIGQTSNEVSPHKDSSNKWGTHIFYFNTDQDWQAEWGGQLLVLEGKKVEGITPDFADFTSETVIPNINNHSFLFKNDKEAWHGVKPLNCPKNRYRKLFNVIFMQK